MLIAAACAKPLPDEGTAEARLYRERCGTSCHQAVLPSSMPYATWQMVLPRMEQRIAATSTPLSASERQVIEAYLKKYSR